MVKSVSVTYGDKSKFQTPDQIWKMFIRNRRPNLQYSFTSLQYQLVAVGDNEEWSFSFGDWHLTVRES